MCAEKQSNAVLQKGSVVRSKSGHDAGSFYAVIMVNGDFAYIADGRRRKVEKPKRKNAKHLALTKTVLSDEEIRTNKKLRRALWNFNFGDSNGPVAC